MPNMFGGDQYDPQYGYSVGKDAEKQVPTPAPDYTKPEVAVQLDLHRRANFAREWPTMPRQLRVRLRELQRFPTEVNHSSCSGFIAGYAAAQPGAFSDAYAQALAYALFCKDEWVHDEVRHASLLD